jgi:hypothetical protein
VTGLKRSKTRTAQAPEKIESLFQNKGDAGVVATVRATAADARQGDQQCKEKRPAGLRLPWRPGFRAA